MRLSLLAVGALGFFASCAEAGPNDREAADAGVVIPTGPDADADATDGGGAEASASDAGCAADFCPVAMPLESRYLLTSVWGTSKEDVWAVGSAGLIVHWNGTTWSRIGSGLTNTLFAIDGSGPGDLWIVSSRAGIYRGLGIENGAMRWAARPPPVRPYDGDNFNDADGLVRAAWVGGADDVWLGGDPLWPCSNRWRARMVDGAVSSWELVQDPSCSTVHAVRAVGGDELWAVGEGKTASQATVGRAWRMKRGMNEPDSGHSAWQELDTQAPAALLAVWGTSQGVWAVGERGTIRHYVPGATRWSIVASPTNTTLRAVWGSGPNDVWAVGDNATIIHFDGTEWALASTVSDLDLHGLWGSGASDIWAVGAGGVLHSTGKK
jgi:hypothetical protein